ncbi:metallophosphoesterase [Myroides injenensis]|uniref:metallophosphoesterase n=1 Tax=Myroides injenensis TaxID=1183151 RepID=UPI000287A359|nr:metallophosphoesterase [Myroides injenensis]
MKKLLFLFIILSYIFGNIYVFSHLYPLVENSNTGTRLIFVGIVLVLTLSVFLFFTLGKKVPIYLASILYKIGTGWLMLSIYAFIFTIILDFVSFLNKSFIHSSSLLLVSYSFNQGVLLFLLIFISALIGFVNFKKKKRVEINITVDNKEVPKPIKIVFISDLHLGYAIERKDLKKWVEIINSEHPDLILIGGDIIDFSLQPVLYYKLHEVLQELSAKYGVYTCLGNHEYLSGVEKSIEFIKSSNITVLRDSIAEINELGISLIGRDDRTNKSRKSLKALLHNNNADHISILLDHQPYQLEVASNNGIDLQLSGHTHRGQMWPISWITDYLFENSHGYLKKDKTTIYVSSGIGIWGGRYRIGTQSEYVVINIK